AKGPKVMSRPAVAGCSAEAGRSRRSTTAWRLSPDADGLPMGLGPGRRLFGTLWPWPGRRAAVPTERAEDGRDRRQQQERAGHVLTRHHDPPPLALDLVGDVGHRRGRLAAKPEWR